MDIGRRIGFICLLGSSLAFSPLTVWAKWDGQGGLTCHNLAVLLGHEENAENGVLKGNFHLIASTSGLKRLNTMFEGASSVSEILVNFGHYVFFRSLQRQVSDEKVPANFVGTVSSHYAKTMEADFAANGLWIGDAWRYVESAKTDATDALLRFLEAGEKNETEYGALLTNECKDVFAGDGNGAFLEGVGAKLPIKFQGQKTIDNLSFVELNQFILPAIKKEFGSLDAFVSWFYSQYTIGVSPTKAGAVLGARTATTKDSLFAYADLKVVKQNLDQAQQYKANLQGYFQTLNSEGTLDFFSQVRKAIHKNERPTVLIKAVAQKIGRSESEAWDLCQKFYATLQTFDYVNPEWIKPTHNFKAEFEGLEGPGFVVFADVKNLGAVGLKVINENLESLQRRVAIMDAKVRRRQLASINGESGAVLQELDLEILAQMEVLQKSLENILMPANAFINQSVLSIRTILGTYEKTLAFKVWYAGDDIFVRAVTKDLSLKDRFMPQLVRELGASMRFGIQEIKENKKVLIKDARIQVGSTSGKLKEHETKDGSDSVYAQYQDGGQISIVPVTP